LGVGDLVSKLTAIFDWKLAFYRRGEPVNDFAALLSDAMVYQFLALPSFDLDGARLLGTSLMLNGIAMEICGSSRPASGSEHLISHALDSISMRLRLHGLQVGLATYLISRVQKNQTERIAELFDRVGVWSEIRSDPFSRLKWREALHLAPSIKEDFYTVLSEEFALAEAEQVLNDDTRLDGCFVD
jgi:glycerol-1-phosphate dehydrogenase [NAD(P)+]